MSMDNKTRKVVIKGSTPSKITTEDNTETVKPEKDWTTAGDKEAHDVFKMKVDELFGSLLAFEMGIDDKS